VKQDGAAAAPSTYVVSDLGASFGPVRLDIGHRHNKGELSTYATGFIRKTEPDRVSFTSPAPPSLPIIIFNPNVYFRRRQLTWIGQDIPRQHARWIGAVLAKLTPVQIRDAFRAGGYPRGEVEGFAVIVEKRIAALNAL
jgi:hypothetical protein